MFGVKHFSCAFPLDFIRWAPPLNHGYETSWWRELFFLVGRLSLLDLLDRGGLMPCCTTFVGGFGGGGGAL
jgi:hypothetical protein